MNFQDFIYSQTPIEVVAKTQSSYSVNKVAEISEYSTKNSAVLNFLKKYNCGLEKIINGLNASNSILEAVK
jgi:hypothetical protein